MNDEREPVISVGPNGVITIGTGYSLGQVLDALELARRAVLAVVLRPEQRAAEMQEP